MASGFGHFTNDHPPPPLPRPQGQRDHLLPPRHEHEQEYDDPRGRGSGSRERRPRNRPARSRAGGRAGTPPRGMRDRLGGYEEEEPPPYHHAREGVGGEGPPRRSPDRRRPPPRPSSGHPSARSPPRRGRRRHSPRRQGPPTRDDGRPWDEGPLSHGPPQRGERPRDARPPPQGHPPREERPWDQRPEDDCPPPQVPPPRDERLWNERSMELPHPMGPRENLARREQHDIDRELEAIRREKANIQREFQSESSRTMDELAQFESEADRKLEGIQRERAQLEWELDVERERMRLESQQTDHHHPRTVDRELEAIHREKAQLEREMQMEREERSRFDPGPPNLFDPTPRIARPDPTPRVFDQPTLFGEDPTPRVPTGQLQGQPPFMNETGQSQGHSTFMNQGVYVQPDMMAPGPSSFHGPPQHGNSFLDTPGFLPVQSGSEHPFEPRNHPMEQAQPGPSFLDTPGFLPVQTIPEPFQIRNDPVEHAGRPAGLSDNPSINRRAWIMAKAELAKKGKNLENLSRREKVATVESFKKKIGYLARKAAHDQARVARRVPERRGPKTQDAAKGKRAQRPVQNPPPKPATITRPATISKPATITKPQPLSDWEATILSAFPNNKGVVEIKKTPIMRKIFGLEHVKVNGKPLDPKEDGLLTHLQEGQKVTVERDSFIIHVDKPKDLSVTKETSHSVTTRGKVELLKPTFDGEKCTEGILETDTIYTFVHFTAKEVFFNGYNLAAVDLKNILRYPREMAMSVKCKILSEETKSEVMQWSQGMKVTGSAIKVDFGFPTSVERNPTHPFPKNEIFMRVLLMRGLCKRVFKNMLMGKMYQSTNLPPDGTQATFIGTVFISSDEFSDLLFRLDNGKIVLVIRENFTIWGFRKLNAVSFLSSDDKITINGFSENDEDSKIDYLAIEAFTGFKSEEQNVNSDEFKKWCEKHKILSHQFESTLEKGTRNYPPRCHTDVKGNLFHVFDEKPKFGLVNFDHDDGKNEIALIHVNSVFILGFSAHNAKNLHFLTSKSDLRMQVRPILNEEVNFINKSLGLTSVPSYVVTLATDPRHWPKASDNLSKPLVFPGNKLNIESKDERFIKSLGISASKIPEMLSGVTGLIPKRSEVSKIAFSLLADQTHRLNNLRRGSGSLYSSNYSPVKMQHCRINSKATDNECLVVVLGQEEFKIRPEHIYVWGMNMRLTAPNANLEMFEDGLFVEVRQHPISGKSELYGFLGLAPGEELSQSYIDDLANVNTDFKFTFKSLVYRKLPLFPPRAQIHTFGHCQITNVWKSRYPEEPMVLLKLNNDKHFFFNPEGFIILGYDFSKLLSIHDLKWATSLAVDMVYSELGLSGTETHMQKFGRNILGPNEPAYMGNYMFIQTAMSERLYPFKDPFNPQKGEALEQLDLFLRTHGTQQLSLQTIWDRKNAVDLQNLQAQNLKNLEQAIVPEKPVTGTKLLVEEESDLKESSRRRKRSRRRSRSRSRNESDQRGSRGLAEAPRSPEPSSSRDDRYSRVTSSERDKGRQSPLRGNNRTSDSPKRGSSRKSPSPRRGEKRSKSPENSTERKRRKRKRSRRAEKRPEELRPTFLSLERMDRSEPGSSSNPPLDNVTMTQELWLQEKERQLKMEEERLAEEERQLRLQFESSDLQRDSVLNLPMPIGPAGEEKQEPLRMSDPFTVRERSPLIMQEDRDPQPSYVRSRSSSPMVLEQDVESSMIYNLPSPTPGPSGLQEPSPEPPMTFGVPSAPPPPTISHILAGSSSGVEPSTSITMDGALLDPDSALLTEDNMFQRKSDIDRPRRQPPSRSRQRQNRPPSRSPERIGGSTSNFTARGNRHLKRMDHAQQRLHCDSPPKSPERKRKPGKKSDGDFADDLRATLNKIRNENKKDKDDNEDKKKVPATKKVFAYPGMIFHFLNYETEFASKLEENYGAVIKKRDISCLEVTVQDSVNINAAIAELDTFVKKKTEELDQETEKVTMVLAVDPNHHGLIIGKGGQRVDELRGRYGVSIKFHKKEQNSKDITVYGVAYRVESCIKAINRELNRAGVFVQSPEGALVSDVQERTLNELENSDHELDSSFETPHGDYKEKMKHYKNHRTYARKHIKVSMDKIRYLEEKLSRFVEEGREPDQKDIADLEEARKNVEANKKKLSQIAVDKKKVRDEWMEKNEPNADLEGVNDGPQVREIRDELKVLTNAKRTKVKIFKKHQAHVRELEELGDRSREAGNEPSEQQKKLLEEARSRLKTWEDKIEEHNVRIRELQGQKNELLEAIAAPTTVDVDRNYDFEGTVSVLRTKFGKKMNLLKNQYETALKDIEAKKSEATAKLSEAENDLAELEDGNEQKAELLIEAEKLKNDIEEADDELAYYQGQNNALKSKVKRTNGRFNEIVKRIQYMKNEPENVCKVERRKIMSELESIKAEI